MFLVDLEQGRIVDDEEIKARARRGASLSADGSTRTQIKLEELPGRSRRCRRRDRRYRCSIASRPSATRRKICASSRADGADGRGAGRLDGHRHAAGRALGPAASCCSTISSSASRKSPTRRSIRSAKRWSCRSSRWIGPRPQPAGPRKPATHIRLELHQPILTNVDLEKIRAIEETADGAFRTSTLDISYPAPTGAPAWSGARRLCLPRADDAVRDGYNIIMLSDRALDRDHIASRRCSRWRPCIII